MRELIGQYLSYSHYQPFETIANPPYVLSDRYICKELDGCLLCTDTEYTIDKDGNIVLVFPNKKVIHIGTVPNTEDGTKAELVLNDHILTVRYKVYASWGTYGPKNPYWEKEEITIDIPSLQQKAEVYYLAGRILNRFKPCYNRWIQNNLKIYSVITDHKSYNLDLNGLVKKRKSGRSYSFDTKKVFCYIDCSRIMDGKVEYKAEEDFFDVFSPYKPDSAEKAFAEFLDEITFPDKK